MTFTQIHMKKVHVHSISGYGSAQFAGDFCNLKFCLGENDCMLHVKVNNLLSSEIFHSTQMNREDVFEQIERNFIKTWTESDET